MSTPRKPSRHPAENLEGARIMLANMPRQRDPNDPAAVAKSDQFKAASDEAAAGMEATAAAFRRAGFEHTEGGSSESEPRELALLLALFAAMDAREVYHCPHVTGVQKARTPMKMLLTQGWVLCNRCVAGGSLPETRRPEDDECDICGDESEFFREFMFTLGPHTYIGNACDECWTFLSSSG